MSSNLKKIGVSAVVASHNEAALLDNCLGSLGFCDEVLVFDLESKDSTAAVAKKHHARLIPHHNVPAVEMLHKDAIGLMKYDWMLITDPDEVIDETLASLVSDYFPRINKKIGVVFVPIQYYFKGKPLKGGVWGGHKNRRLLVHTKRVEFVPNVHDGVHLRKSYSSETVSYSNGNIIHHYWINSYRQLITKHLRYIRGEGKSRFDRGERYNWRILAKTPLQSFKEYWRIYKGYKDGPTGLFLALFWAWYNWACILSLRKYQRSQEALID